jgi:hypothetical protein
MSTETTMSANSLRRPRRLAAPAHAGRAVPPSRGSPQGRRYGPGRPCRRRITGLHGQNPAGAAAKNGGAS